MNLNNTYKHGFPSEPEEKSLFEKQFEAYQKKRRAHWNHVAAKIDRTGRIGDTYHKLLNAYYGMLVPRDSRILEVGCGLGNLLASLKPRVGVGIDFSQHMIRRAKQKYPQLTFIQGDAHELPIKGSFDVIILSDLVNDLWDVQRVFQELLPLCHPGTRVLINSYNNLWRVPLKILKLLGLGAFLLEQNWLAPQDVKNLLGLAGFDAFRCTSHILLPFEIPFLSALSNRYLVHFIPFRWFAFTNLFVARLAPEKCDRRSHRQPSVSIVIPARNEAGNILPIIERTPELGGETELIFVEGHSADETYTAVEQAMTNYPGKKIRLYRQTGRGKGDAVRLGFQKADGEILMILDADMTVPPEDLKRFYEALVNARGDFINGVRLVYPLEDRSMMFFNILGNKFFSLAFTWLLQQPIKDTLCGTKILWKRDYDVLAAQRNYFGDFDPFGDFDLLFGAAKLSLKIVEIPIRYRSRRYGATNIDRWRHGWMLLKMVLFAARRIKFV